MCLTENTLTPIVHYKILGELPPPVHSRMVAYPEVGKLSRVRRCEVWRLRFDAVARWGLGTPFADITWAQQDILPDATLFMNCSATAWEVLVLYRERSGEENVGERLAIERRSVFDTAT